MTDLNNLITQIDAFRDARQWREHHNAKDLALSLSLEAAELLECFQWQTSDAAVNNHLDEIKDELADVFIYAFTLSSTLELDVSGIIQSKMKKNAKKYPAPATALKHKD
ncbi:nucleotide pyrophosphohydrolase [Halolactibacillus miurensis]|uniref:NTP pyrophosphatase, house-cleaning of non-canonical NTPs n=1 Tax=Halolactibacillus miurensis TaxID=306541 RepID=A0A1I6P6V5_9BACI|nr:MULTISPECIES: nucleotide pyrophosphohydrolase [Halolactibacillus]GEM03086.1 nucleotide pyrophosphohydrolase [Halolactibacillus miurensis]SFS35838.1 NTP pyrophosphatase, house-cleaning of non-canonical NTPs [Halolactibacillus miurensis]